MLRVVSLDFKLVFMRPNPTTTVISFATNEPEKRRFFSGDIPIVATKYPYAIFASSWAISWRPASYPRQHRQTAEDLHLVDVDYLIVAEHAQANSFSGRGAQLDKLWMGNLS
jgi:hypothetical protein